jgi:tetratricopeptide (TPR) repeat protein
MLRRLTLLLLIPFVLAAASAYAQAPPLTLPDDPSQQATATQRIGLTDLTISYHRPAVRGRQIWGTLVPYGEVWRAGANENTVLTLTSAARVGGQEVPAGSYGLHMIPAAADWTVILSRESTAWGSFFYDAKQDAARFSVTPRTVDHQEHLAYAFDDPSADSVILTLRWEKLAVSIPIGVDTPAVVVESLRRELHGMPGFFWQSYARAATWSARHGVNLEEAQAWADRAISMNRNFTTLRAKAAVLEKTGDAAGAAALREQALTRATEAEMNVYGYELLQAGSIDQAIGVFRGNVDKYPDSWNVYDSLGEALAAKGDKAAARAQYEKALSMVQDETNRKRIHVILAGL